MRWEPNTDLVDAWLENLTHVSPSLIGGWKRCGVQHYYTRIEGLRIPPAGAMHVGTGAHVSAEKNREGFIKSEKWATVEDAKGVAADAFESRWGEEPPEDQSEKGDLLDATVHHAEIHATELAPAFRPLHVEQSFTLHVEDAPWPVEGYVDVIGTDWRSGSDVIVRDLKTTASPTRWKKVGDLVDTPQFGLYAAAVAAAENAPLDAIDVGAEVSRRRVLKRGVEAQGETVTAPAERLVARAEHEVRAVSAALKAKSFPPAPAGAWWCSSKFCGFHREAGGPCPFGR